MRLDTANRSFLLLMGVALAPFLLLGMVGCGVVSTALFRATADGTGGWGVRAWLAFGFLAVTAVGAILGLRSLWLQRRATVALARFVDDHRITLDAGLAETAAAEGLSRVDLVDVGEPMSLTFGIRRPRVVVSQGLVDAVSTDELRAVLVHEGYHVRNLDPLKVVLARAVSATYFFLPALRYLRSRYLAGRELAADRTAVRSCGRVPLVGALYKVAGSGGSFTGLTAAAAIGGSDLLDVRLAQLEDDQEPPLPAITRLALASTVVGVALMAVGLAATVALVGWPTGGGMGSSGSVGVLGPLACGGVWLLAALALYRSRGDHRATAGLE